jgi:hypothetical protein
VGAGRKPGVFILVLAAAFAGAATAQTLALQNRWARCLAGAHAGYCGAGLQPARGRGGEGSCAGLPLLNHFLSIVFVSSHLPPTSLGLPPGPGSCPGPAFAPATNYSTLTIMENGANYDTGMDW